MPDQSAFEHIERATDGIPISTREPPPIASVSSIGLICYDSKTNIDVEHQMHGRGSVAVEDSQSEEVCGGLATRDAVTAFVLALYDEEQEQRQHRENHPESGMNP
jgi:hypothetical protein